MNRYFGNQLAIYALLATAIAALGLYGVMTHSVGGRRRELAVRVAVGATRLDVIRLVLGDASRLAGAGIAIGLLMALGTTGFAAAMLYEVSARDPVVFGGVALLLACVALVTAAVVATVDATRPAPRQRTRRQRAQQISDDDDGPYGQHAGHVTPGVRAALGGHDSRRVRGVSR